MAPIISNAIMARQLHDKEFISSQLSNKELNNLCQFLVNYFMIRMFYDFIFFKSRLYCNVKLCTTSFTAKFCTCS